MIFGNMISFRSYFLAVLFSMIAVDASGMVHAQYHVRPTPDQHDIVVEEYEPIYFEISDMDRNRFVRVNQSNSCETHDLLFVYDSSISDNLVESTNDLSQSTDMILMSVWEREISESLSQSCEGLND